jgi:hypothetical protein
MISDNKQGEVISCRWFAEAEVRGGELAGEARLSGGDLPSLVDGQIGKADSPNSGVRSPCLQSFGLLSCTVELGTTWTHHMAASADEVTE